jgi:hypothetical protein
MTDLIQELGVQCPYCGEHFTTTVDASAGDQEYIEDCQVCCRPILFALHFDDNAEIIDVGIMRDDE